MKLHLLITTHGCSKHAFARFRQMLLLVLVLSGSLASIAKIETEANERAKITYEVESDFVVQVGNTPTASHCKSFYHPRRFDDATWGMTIHRNRGGMLLMDQPSLSLGLVRLIRC